MLFTLAPKRSGEIATAVDDGRVAVCLPFLLEAGYSARDGRDHADLLAELLALPYLEIDQAVERRAADVQGQLARAGHHRLPPVDIIVAAIAERHGHDILHYDADFDLMLERTDLEYGSVWLAERGAL